MSPRSIDADELDLPVEGADRVISELERYVRSTAADAPRGLSDRVLAAIENEPAPRRGLIAWLLPAASGAGARPFARAAVLGGVLVLAVAGAMFAGQLAGFMRGVGGDATPTPRPSFTESERPTPPSSLDAGKSQTVTASEGENPSAEEAGSPEASADESGEASNAETPDATPGETPEAPTTESSQGS